MALTPAASSYTTLGVVYASCTHATSASKQADGKLIFTNFMPTCGVNGVKVKVNQEKQHYSRNRARNSSTNGFTRSGASSCGQWPTSENARTSSTASNRRSASTRFGGVQGSLPP